MRDDDALKRDEEAFLPEKYWGEEQWEKFLLDNERLMDEYEKVLSENPEREWKDPTDLYLKVHHGIDLGEEVAQVDLLEAVVPAPEESQRLCGGDPDEDNEDIAKISFEDHPLYQLAFDFGMKVMDWVKHSEIANQNTEDVRIKEICFHGLKIAADIAGGMGIGIDEDGLCGNIVKHRWALGHARECGKKLEWLKQVFPETANLEDLLRRLHEVQTELEKEIVSLRSRVWW